MTTSARFFCIMRDKAVYANKSTNIHVRLNILYKLNAKQFLIAKNSNHTNGTPSQEKNEGKDVNHDYDDNGTATMMQYKKAETIQKTLHHPVRHTQPGLQANSEMKLEISALRRLE